MAKKNKHRPSIANHKKNPYQPEASPPPPRESRAKEKMKEILRAGGWVDRGDADKQMNLDLGGGKMAGNNNEPIFIHESNSGTSHVADALASSVTTGTGTWSTGSNDIVINAVDSSQVTINQHDNMDEVNRLKEGLKIMHEKAEELHGQINQLTKEYEELEKETIQLYNVLFDDYSSFEQFEETKNMLRSTLYDDV